MRLPRKILICGTEHKLVADPSYNGGDWDGDKKVITVGTRCPAEVSENLLHEVIEACLATRNLRYAIEMEEVDNEHYLYSFDHNKYEQLVKDIAAALKGLSFK